MAIKSEINLKLKPKSKNGEIKPNNNIIMSSDKKHLRLNKKCSNLGAKNDNSIEILSLEDLINLVSLGNEINSEIIKKALYPPNGRVRVAAPLKTTDEKIKLLVLSKRAWIKRQQTQFQKQERESKREFVSGESHFFMGRRYLLNVTYVEAKPKIVINGKSHIDMYVRPKTSLKKREDLMNKFYRSELQKQIPHLLEKWKKITGIDVKEVRIKKMKTKWGSCTPEHKRVWLNLELAKKPLYNLEYVLVHEMTHIIEKNHTEKFKLLMDSFLPKWTQYKEELNNSKLGYAKWDFARACLNLSTNCAHLTQINAIWAH